MPDLLDPQKNGLARLSASQRAAFWFSSTGPLRKIIISVCYMYLPIGRWLWTTPTRGPWRSVAGPHHAPPAPGELDRPDSAVFPGLLRSLPSCAIRDGPGARLSLLLETFHHLLEFIKIFVYRCVCCFSVNRTAVNRNRSGQASRTVAELVFLICF